MHIKRARSFGVDFFGIVLCAIIITQSFRFFLLPVPDTISQAIAASLVFVLALFKQHPVRNDFPKLCLILTSPLVLGFLFDFMSSRSGYESLIFIVKFASIILTGYFVSLLSLYQIKRLIILCTLMLLGHLIVFEIAPGFAVSAGRHAGITDPFILHGRAIERSYFGYFQSNVACYSILFILLSWILISASKVHVSKIVRMSVCLTLVIFILLTGSRGGVIILVFLSFALLAINQRTFILALTVLAVASVSISYILSLWRSLLSIREASNEARADRLLLYLNEFGENWIVGRGYESMRVDIGVSSHNFFLEILASFGVLFGASFILLFISFLVLRSRMPQQFVLGMCLLGVGMFSNSLLLLPSLFSLYLPIFFLITDPQGVLEFRFQRLHSAGVIKRSGRRGSLARLKPSKEGAGY